MTWQGKTKLTREGWFYLLVLLFILGGAVMREVNLLFVLSGMLAGPLILSLRAVAVSLRGLEVERTMPHRVYAGDPLVVNLNLHNTRRRVGSFALTVEDHIGSDTTGFDTHSAYFHYVPAGESRQQAYRTRLTRRGLYHIGPFRISTGFPFGLMRRTVVMGETDLILVYPRMGRLTRCWAARQHEAFEGGRWQLQRYHRAEGEYYGVRPWRDGDSRRSIHWRSSARLGQLVVRQFEQPHTRDIALLVDLWKPDGASTADLQRVERVLSFAATVANDVCREGNANLLLATTGEEPSHLSGPASPQLLQEVMDRLAVCQAGDGGQLYDMLKEVADAIDSGAEVVLVSTRLPDLTGNLRLAEFWHSASRRALMRRIRIVVDQHGLQDDFEEGNRAKAMGPVNVLAEYFQD